MLGLEQLAQIGQFAAGAAAVFGSLDSAFGTGRQNVKIAKDALNLSKNQFEEETRRYNEDKANIQSNVDMIGDVFGGSGGSVWNRL